MALQFDEVFKISTIASKLNRTHPHIKKDKNWVLQTIIMHSVFALEFCLFLYNIICHDLKTNNFSQTCKNCAFSEIYVVVTIFYLMLTYERKIVLNLKNLVNRDYEMMNNLKNDEKVIVTKYIKQGIYVCKQWVALGVISLGSMVIKSIYLMVYSYCKYEFKLVPLHDIFYPEFIEEHKDTLYVYMFSYILTLYYGMFAILMYVAYVPLGPIMMLHASGQLEIVNLRINELLLEVDNEIINRKLVGIITQLQYICSFVNQITVVFKIVYELTLKGTALLLPVTIYELMEATSRGEFSPEFLTIMIGGIVISSSPCYYSQLLMEKSEAVRKSIYACGWELNYDRRTRTTLLILLMYGQRPIAIRTVFRTLCLETLTDVFQQSYVIFNFINTVWE